MGFTRKKKEDDFPVRPLVAPGTDIPTSSLITNQPAPTQSLVSGSGFHGRRPLPSNHSVGANFIRLAVAMAKRGRG